jgi:hypothetical protein
MVEIVVPLAFLFSLAVVLVAVTKIVSDGRTRRRLVDTGATPERVAAVLAPMPGDPALYESLRWGIVAAAVGVALVVVQFLPYRLDEPIVYGVLVLFGAAGLLLYWMTARRLMARSR